MTRKTRVVAAMIDEDVAAIASGLRNVVAEVELMRLLERLPLLLGEDLPQHRLGLLRL